jgi:L-threonylcarbamoyladenylate synthase
LIATTAARALAAAFWPGPLTLVLRRAGSCRVAPLASAGLDTLAVRVPGHAVAQRFLAACARPVAAPSANRSGQISPTTAAHVIEELNGRIAAVLDSGPCPVGIESTVVDATSEQAVLLRPGGVTEEAIEALIGPIGHTSDSRPPRSPGRLASHYAPRLPLRLEARDVGANEALLAFGRPLPGAGAVFNLSDAGDLQEAAARLFAGLRALDHDGMRDGLACIAAMPLPRFGLGAAITDRLARAAAPRGS